MTTWREWVAIAVGGAAGSVARVGAAGLVARWVGETFPWGTLGVNVSGSFAIGLLVGLAGQWFEPTLRQLLVAGFCGGYTTFSTFSLQTLRLLEDRAWLAAAGNAAGSVGLCLLAVAAGHALGRQWAPGR